MARVRDFVYLDVERVRSLVSQLDEGVVDSFSKSLGKSSSAKGGLKGGFPGIASGDVGVEQLWRSGSEESRSLHDYIFTRLEDLLLSERLVVEIEASNDLEEASKVRSKLQSTDFLLIDACVELNDLARMNSLLKKFNEIGKFFVWNQIQRDPNKKNTESQLAKDLRDPASGLQIDKNLQAGLSLMIENLIGEQILIRSMPFEVAGGTAFVGVLDPDCLRERMVTILTKFGSRPSERWKVFCQVASLEPHGTVASESSVEEVAGGGIGNSLRAMFNAVRVLDKTAVPYSPFDVTITPIAVYREDSRMRAKRA